MTTFPRQFHAPTCSQLITLVSVPRANHLRRRRHRRPSFAISRSFRTRRRRAAAADGRELFRKAVGLVPGAASSANLIKQKRRELTAAPLPPVVVVVVEGTAHHTGTIGQPVGFINVDFTGR